MNKGLIRKFATLGLTLACAFVMSATLPGCATGNCKKSAGCTKCKKPCGEKQPCDKKAPCDKKG